MSSFPSLHSIASDYTVSGRTFVQYWKKLVPIILIPNALTFILGIAFKAAVGNAFAQTSLTELVSLFNLNFIVIVLLGLSIILVQSIGFVAMLYIIIYHEQKTVFHAFEESLTYLWRFVVTSVFIFIHSLLGLVVGFIPVAILSIIVALFSIEALNMTFDWFVYIALAVSAIYTTFFVFAPYILISENSSIRGAMKKSFALVRAASVSVIVRTAVFSALSSGIALSLFYIPRIGDVLSVMVIVPFSALFFYMVFEQHKQPSQAITEPTAHSIPEKKVV